MKKKSLLTMIIALGLIAVIGAGATLAYLTSNTQTLNNTFTVGAGIKITLDEEDITKTDGSRTVEGNKYEDLQPGDVMTKDPTVTVAANSTESYVFMRVEGIDALEALKTEGKQDFTVGDINAAWIKVANIKDGDVKDGIYQYVGTQYQGSKEHTVAKNENASKLPALFEKVTYNKTASGIVEGTLPSIVIKACAVQSANTTEAEALAATVWGNK
jgi:predicted ribosomally synthesized peptide with SipW-like signal peptide